MQPQDPDPLTPEEEKLIEKLIPLIKRLIEKSYLTGTTYRDTHPKGHGAVRATFTVESSLPEERRVGFFARPGEYPAWIRFSNLNATPQPDIKKDDEMPVENPMVPWDPEISPYVKVATLTIERQSFDSPEQMKFCEDLSFNPWRTLPEHRPLGAVNRANKRQNK